MHRSVSTRAFVALAVTAACALTASPALAATRQATVAKPTPGALAAAAADRLVNSGAPALHLAAGETLTRTGVLNGTRGLQYVTYARTHLGLPVVGGDVVVTTDAAGVVRGSAVAQRDTIKVGTTATVTAAAALATARAQLVTVQSSKAPRLVVLTWGATPKLAWEAGVTGLAKQNRPSVLKVYVDATTGAVLDRVDDVREGTGNGFYYGAVDLNTSGSGTSFSLTDTTRPGLQCGGQDGAVFTGTDDTWGNASGTNLETACVDALYSAGQETNMLRDWFHRNGIRGDGTTPPIRVGLNDVNAFWNGTFTSFGHNQANTQQATPIDVVGHEMGHAIFQFTPGGTGSGNENGGINESASDIWGALTEAYANNPLDPPDYTVGEEVNLVGQGPIRFMFNPSQVGDPNCFSAAIPSTEVHAAAGPLNHWFYLTAEGAAPVGKPVSPTCNASVVTGLGIRTAGEIFYNAELLKTSTWKYVNIRTATLTAAKNLFPGSCTEYNTVKAAWNAISVPAQTGEPTCNLTGNDFSLATSPAAGAVQAGSATTTTIRTAITAGATQNIALVVGGLPTGTTATFDPATVAAGESSTLTITTAASTAGGTYPLTITGTGDDVHSTDYSLVVIGAPGCSAANATKVDIPDAGPAVTSTIGINGCGRNASAGAAVGVNITHTYRGDLVIDLIAPDGTSYRLKASNSADNAGNVITTFTADLSSEAADGNWTLKVQDVFAADSGAINSWSLNL